MKKFRLILASTILLQLFTPTLSFALVEHQIDFFSSDLRNNFCDNFKEMFGTIGPQAGLTNIKCEEIRIGFWTNDFRVSFSSKQDYNLCDSDYVKVFNVKRMVPLDTLIEIMSKVGFRSIASTAQFPEIAPPYSFIFGVPDCGDNN